MARDDTEGTGGPTAGVQNPDEPDGDFHQTSLWRWSGPASLVGGALFAVLGWMFVAGAIAQGSDEALANARPDELVQILDSLDAENARLEQEKRRLAAEVESLTSGSDSAALAQAQKRKESLEVLAGTTKVRGPGVRIVIRDEDGGVDAAEILDTVQELRDAGAESIEVAERRVVVNTWFANPPDSSTPAILVSGELRPPRTRSWRSVILRRWPPRWRFPAGSRTRYALPVRGSRWSSVTHWRSPPPSR